MKKIIAALMIICLMATFDHSLAQQDTPYIPFGEDLGAYQPQMDGYYALIEVRAQTSDVRIVINELPLLIYQDKALVRIADFGQLFSLPVEVRGDEASIETANRKLWFTKDQITGKWVVDSVYGTLAPFVERSVTFSTPPRQIAGSLWVPLMDTASLLGMDVYLGEEKSGDPYLYIRYPKRGVLDVLADLKDPRVQGERMYYFPPEHIDDFNTMATATGVVRTVRNIMKMDLTEVLRDATGTNVAPLIQEILGAEKNEYIDLTETIFDNFNSSLDTKELLPGFEEMKKLNTGMDIAGNVLEALSVGATMVLYNYAFIKRDKLALKALETYRDSNVYHDMGKARFNAATSEIDRMKSDMSYSISHTLGDKWAELLVFFADLISTSPSPAGLASGFFGIADLTISAVIPAWNQTYSSMDAFIQCVYGQLMEGDVQTLLNESFDIYGGSLSEEQLKNCMIRAYLFLKTCAVTQNAADAALGQEASADMCDLTILTQSYDEDLMASLLPESIIDDAVHGDHAAIISAATPLYLRLAGQVLRWDTKEPIEDALVEFSCEGETCGFISGTPKGIFEDVYVPVMIPQLGAGDLQNLKIEARFTSPTSFGDDERTALFERKNTILDTAYLGGSELHGRVVHADTALPLEGVTVQCSSSRETFTTVTDDNGQFHFVHIPEGEYTLRSEKTGYQPDERDVYVGRDTVMVLFDAIELSPGNTIDSVVVYYDKVLYEQSESFQGILMRVAAVETHNHRDTQEKKSHLLDFTNEPADSRYNEYKSHNAWYSFIFESYFSGKYVSILGQETFPHGRLPYTFYYEYPNTLNPETGEVLKLADIFIDETAVETFQAMLVDLIREHQEKHVLRFNYPLEHYARRLIEGNYWTLKKDRLTLLTDSYFYGSHSQGAFNHEFTLEEDLIDLIRPDFLPLEISATGTPLVCTGTDKTDLVVFGSPSTVGIEVDGNIQDLYLYRDGVLILQANYLEHSMVWLRPSVAGEYRMVWTSMGKEKTRLFEITGSEEAPDIAILAMEED